MENKKKRSWLRLSVNVLSLLLFIALVIAYLTDNLGVNPIQKAQHLSGDIALILLLLSLSITPLYTLTGVRQITTLKKAFGLNAFYFAAVHVLIFLGLDYGFNLNEIIGAFGFRPFIWAGLAAFLILAVMAITSIKRVKFAVSKVWKKIHSYVYLAGILVVLHYAWSVKGNLFQLSGAIGKPLIAAIVLVVLLILRIKPVKEAILRLRCKAASRAEKETSRV